MRRILPCLLLTLPLFVWSCGAKPTRVAAQLATSPDSSTIADAGVPAMSALASDASTPSSEVGRALRMLPHVDITEVVAGDLARVLAGWIDASARSGGAKGDPEIAIVVDDDAWSTHSVRYAATEVERALAANRAKLSELAKGGRFALLTCDSRDSIAARTEVPFTKNPYDVQLGARKLARRQFQRDSPPLGSAKGTCSAEISSLGWRTEPWHVALMTGDRPSAPEWNQPMPSACKDPETKMHSTLCVPAFDPVRYAKELNTIPVELRTVAALFRDGSYREPDSSSALSVTLEDALNAATEAGRATDVALVVHTAGRMGQALHDLAAAGPALDRFVAGPDHRLALIRWDNGRSSDVGKSRTVTEFTSKKGTVPNAVTRLRATSGDDYGNDLFGAIDAARRLRWGPTSAKFVIVLTAASAANSAVYDDVVNWAEGGSVNLTIIDPAHLVTGNATRVPRPPQ